MYIYRIVSKRMTLMNTGFKSKLLLLALLLCLANHSYGQDRSDFWNRVRFGGGIGLSFGNGFFSGTLAPAAIYQVSPLVAMGVGLNATYNSVENEYSSTVLGGNVMALFNPIPQLQISTEFEQLNVNRKFDSRFGLANENYWYPALFIGAGFRNNNVTFGVRYDVLYDQDRSIYANAWMPFVRVFF